jgi:hypothetical protein
MTANLSIDIHCKPVAEFHDTCFNKTVDQIPRSNSFSVLRESDLFSHWGFLYFREFKY